ncbi:MAG TPA: alpha/beta fold hydrolase [Chloroflexota bacterium]|nr:alpha/beta fold hydrolase [Chloroflexota bacterium]
MPVFEMPLNELRQYQGRNPRPADMDAYWADALSELDKVDGNVQLQPVAHAAGFADCFDLRFTGVGGARIYAKYLRPKVLTQNPLPAVVVFHGYSGSSPEWFSLLPYVAQGFCVAALDCRGQGGRSEDVGGVIGNTLEGHIIRGLLDGPRKLLYRQIFLDCVQLTRIVMDFPEIDAKRIGVTGASQGGGLTLACAALEPRVKLAAPVYPFLSDYLRTWEMDLDVDAYAELRQFLRRFDPQHLRHDEIFTTLGYIDVQHLAARIQARVLLAVGLMDTICAPSTQFAAYNKITSAKDLVLYPDFAHETLPELADLIFTFLCDHL